MAITPLLIDKHLSLPLHNSVSSHTHTGDEFIPTTSTPPHPAPDASGTVTASAVFLRPRPLARCAGVLALVPLLPKRAPLKALPSEVWKKVLDMLVDDARREDRAQWDPVKKEFAWSLALVCRQFKDIVLPLLYNQCYISTLSSLQKFTAHLHSSEQRWDSIRRIKYSTPGRWVSSLSLCRLDVVTRKETYRADELLTTLFPLLPFLTRLELSLSMQLSRRAMCSLGVREGARHLRALKSVKYDSVGFVSMALAEGGIAYEDPLTELVACLHGLEELEIIGPGLDDLELAIASSTATTQLSDHQNDRVFSSPPSSPLHLPHLHTLTILSMPTSDLLIHLTNTPLPSLRNVIITPYGTLSPPLSHVTRFLKAHGPSIRTLVLHTPPAWPTAVYPPPSGLLEMMPRLKALSLELPPPPPQSTSTLTASFWSQPPTQPSNPHPLRSLWIPRPTATFRTALVTERLLPPYTCLMEVRARDVRWARKGMNAQAEAAGVQGEMRVWQRLLKTKSVLMVDAEGRVEAL